MADCRHGSIKAAPNRDYEIDGCYAERNCRKNLRRCQGEDREEEGKRFLYLYCFSLTTSPFWFLFNTFREKEFDKRGRQSINGLFLGFGPNNQWALGPIINTYFYSPLGMGMFRLTKP